jgi:hypothetical protein
VLVQDGAVVPAPATAQQLLSEHRGWSYTAALVQQQYDVMDWELHIERLIRCACWFLKVCSIAATVWHHPTPGPSPWPGVWVPGQSHHT